MQISTPGVFDTPVLNGTSQRMQGILLYDLWSQIIWSILQDKYAAPGGKIVERLPRDSSLWRDVAQHCLLCFPPSTRVLSTQNKAKHGHYKQSQCLCEPGQEVHNSRVEPAPKNAIHPVPNLPREGFN